MMLEHNLGGHISEKSGEDNAKNAKDEVGIVFEATAGEPLGASSATVTSIYTRSSHLYVTLHIMAACT